jgi:hypothetical protein
MIGLNNRCVDRNIEHVLRKNTIVAGGINGNWVTIHRNGLLSATVNGQTRTRLRQISRREFDALLRKRQAAIIGEEFRRRMALVRDSALTVSRTTTEHFEAKSQKGHIVVRRLRPSDESENLTKACSDPSLT